MKPKKKHFPSRIYRDSWDLDTAFYKWLLPRLKCYREYANGYFKNFTQNDENQRKPLAKFYRLS